MAESLAAGDTTSAFATWMAQLTGNADMNTRIRDALAASGAYNVTLPTDTTTLLSRFLRTRAAP